MIFPVAVSCIVLSSAAKSFPLPTFNSLFSNTVVIWIIVRGLYHSRFQYKTSFRDGRCKLPRAIALLIFLAAKSSKNIRGHLKSKQTHLWFGMPTLYLLYRACLQSFGVRDQHPRSYSDCLSNISRAFSIKPLMQFFLLVAGILRHSTKSDPSGFVLFYPVLWSTIEDHTQEKNQEHLDRGRQE